MSNIDEGHLFRKYATALRSHVWQGVPAFKKIFFHSETEFCGYALSRCKRERPKLGDIVGTAVARINQEFPLTKPAVEDAEGQAKGKYKTFQALVMQALQLRKTHREVFILCDIRGYSVTETASMLEISEESVLRRLGRARSEMGLDGEDGASAITELIDI